MAQVFQTAINLLSVAGSVCPIPGLPIIAQFAQEILRVIQEKDTNNEDLKRLLSRVDAVTRTVCEKCLEIIEKGKPIVPPLMQYVHELSVILSDISYKCVRLQSQGRWTRYVSTKSNSTKIATMFSEMDQADRTFNTKIQMHIAQTVDSKPNESLHVIEEGANFVVTGINASVSGSGNTHKNVTYIVGR